MGKKYFNFSLDVKKVGNLTAYANSVWHRFFEVKFSVSLNRPSYTHTLPCTAKQGLNRYSLKAHVMTVLLIANLVGAMLNEVLSLSLARCVVDA